MYAVPMQTGRSPNLLISPPIRGPSMDRSPHEIDPANAKDDIGALNCCLKGSKSIAKPPKRKPSGKKPKKSNEILWQIAPCKILT